jgi:hypothetical protein
MKLARWLYRHGRPNRLAMLLNSISGVLHGVGIAPNYLVTLEVPGRQSGRQIRLPLVMVSLAGERFLVSMLGPDVNWVRNVRAAGGRAALRHGRREQVLLEEVPVECRAPVLKAYLRRAPGARPHIPIDKDAPLTEFARVSPQLPVFQVRTIPDA